MKKVFAIMLAALMVAAMFAGCGAKDGAGSGSGEFVIGMSGPLTGGAAMYGIAVKNAAQLAVDEINAAGGLDGIQFELVMYDDKHDATTVETLYAKLYEEGMQASLGTVTTKPGLEFKTFAKEDNVFFLTPSATGDAIPEFANGYQMCFADSNQGTAAAQFFNENYQGKKIGVFYKSDDEYSVGIYNNFKKNLDASFGDISAATASFTGEASTFDSQIQLLKDCEVVFMPIYYTPASQFMTQAMNVDNSIAVYYGCDGFDGIGNIEGFDINAIPQSVTMLSHFNSKATSGKAADYISAYVAEYGDKAPLNQFGAAAYDCVWAIYESLKVAKANGEDFSVTTSASDFCDVLVEVFTSDSFVFHGVTGAPKADGKSNISWTDDGFVNKEAVKYVVKAAN